MLERTSELMLSTPLDAVTDESTVELVSWEEYSTLELEAS